MTESPDDESTSALLDGRYQLGECVGQGGMARVYRAEDVMLGRTVAVKIMRTEAEQPSIPPRAHMEMSLLASLNHPSLVTLFDAKIVPGQPEYLVMELVQGPSLGTVLNDGPLDAAEVAGIGEELASALHVVHRAGIVHRDVKPSNVLLSDSSRPGRRYWAKLADFGVAYLADSTRHTTPGTVIGTAAYLAPEQVRGEPAGPAADVYALGLLLLETITGSRAFPEASGIGRVMARLVDDPDVPAWLGPEWAALLHEMIARDPAARPTALDVAHRLPALPTDLVRPAPATASSSIDQPTQPLVVPAAAVAPPADAVTRTGRAAVRRSRRSRRTRMAVLGGVAATIVAALVLAGQLWAGGLSGGTDPAVLPPATEPTAPVDDSPQITTVDEDEAAELPAEPVSVDRPADGEEGPAPEPGDGPSDTAADTPQGSEQAGKDPDKGTGEASKESGRESQGEVNRSEKAAEKANENAGKKGGAGKGGPGKKD